jgi:N-acetylated-alpha-linked acidic dipeptidase
MTTVPHIPSLPISYASAEKILWRLGGPRVPDEWQGGLPFSYHIGPGGTAIEMSVEMDEGLRPIYNVFARIPGAEAPDELVLLGNHRDAWNHGGIDPNSGTAAMLETARGLAAALKTGWRPRRTLLLATWDAEEYGLVGSTEWGEDKAEELQANLVAYVNLDSAVTGDELGVDGIPSMRDLMREVLSAIPEPRKGGTVGEAWEKKLREAWNKNTPVVLDGPDVTFDVRLKPLGSGSDYTVFVDHLGIPAVNFGFSGSSGVYHSVYDTFRWVEKFGDPGFHYSAVAARIYGLLAMRLASADIVPLRFESYAASLRDHLDKLQRDTRRKARPTGEEPDKEPLNPDFWPVTEALVALEIAGTAADSSVDRVIASENRSAAAEMNALMIQVERAFLSEEGLPPNRPWFRHVLYAPGTTTGYASWPFPGLTQALEDKDAAAFDHEMDKVVDALNEASTRLHAIAAIR